MLQLETDRLMLRAPVPEDADALAPMYADPEVMRFVGDGRTLTRSETERSVRRMIERWDADGFGLFTTVRKEDEAVIGRVGLLVWNIGDLGADHARGGAERADRGRGRLHARARLLGPGLRDRGGRRGA